MRKFAAVLIGASFVASGLAGTHKVPGEEPIATIEIPDKWPVKARGEHIEGNSPDSAIRFLAMPAEARKIAESMGEAMRYLRNRDGIVVKAESVKQEAGKIKEMEVRNVSWDAKDAKGEIKIRFAIITVEQGKPFLVAYWGSADAEKKYRTELDKILQSIKKA